VDPRQQPPLLQPATLADLEVMLPLMQGYYGDDHLQFDAGRQRAALSRLLQEPQWGRVWLIQWQQRTVGYVAVCFGFSLELGGNDAYLDELYVSPADRGHGVVRHALQHVERALTGLGIHALHLEVDTRNASAQRLYSAIGYTPRDRYFLMSKQLSA
jgi:diamine N-acetyltransferase